MTSELRRWVRASFLRLGWDVRRVQSIERIRWQRYHDEMFEQWRFMKNYGFRSILDIGANTGVWATFAREILPEAKIYSFEPLAECYAELFAQQAKLQPAEAFHCALGEENGTATIHRNKSTVSSSLLPMNSLHWEELPQTVETTDEQITVRRLDDVFADRPLESPFFVKIDVQGFEDRVLRGGSKTIRTAAAVVLEMSSFRLYEEQPLFDDLYPVLRDWGFVYRGNVGQWISHRDGRILQFDGLFENTDFPPGEQPPSRT